MHHFVTEMCTHVHISVTKWCIPGYGTGVCWDLCDRPIAVRSRGIMQTWSVVWPGNCFMPPDTMMLAFELVLYLMRAITSTFGIRVIFKGYTEMDISRKIMQSFALECRNGSQLVASYQ